jgi:uncharacterized protein
MEKWLMTQTWEHLLFFHWELDPQKVKPLLPSELELDTYAGKAWMTVLPFKVSHQRFRLLPEIPFLHSYFELNVRTYVKYRGIPGVYFFSLDVNNPLTVLGTNALSLPYKNAKMVMHRQRNDIVFTSNRLSDHAKFSAVYRPASPPAPVTSESLDYWLMERYRLFTKWGKWILQGEIGHDCWEVSTAKALISENSVSPIELSCEPDLTHYSSRKQAFIQSIKKYQEIFFL